MQILVYVTDNKERYLGGDPLTLYMENGEERQEFLFSLGKTLRADIIQLRNGDHIMYIKDQEK